MFERDKEELRGMGIPVETVLNSHGEVEGYRIDREAYAMPALAFTGPELAVLGLAARAWSDASLGASAQGALRKIEASGPQPGPAPLPDLLASPVLGDAELPHLWRAVRERRVVEFQYRGLGDGEVTARVVEPWGTAHYGGAWYLVGRDRSREAERIFRTSRIVGAVRVVGKAEAFLAGDEESVQALVARLAEGPDERRGRLRVREGSGARLRLRAVDSTSDEIVVGFSDVDALAREVAELGAAAQVIEPDDLAAAVRASLRRVAEAHA